MKGIKWLAVAALSLSSVAVFADAESNDEKTMRMIEDAVLQEMIDEVVRGEFDEDVEAPITKELQASSQKDLADLPLLLDENSSIE